MSVAGVDQENLPDSTNLGDSDSLFHEFKGVKIHHKIYECKQNDQEDNAIGLPMILFHGFMANVVTWEKLMKPLGEMVGAKVLAYDRPGFGLTNRTSDYYGGESGPSNHYSMAFSVLATLSFIDLLGAEKVILMGHSAGCLVAINTYFKAPERVSALILVAPAMFAPVLSIRQEEKSGMGKNNNKKDWNSNSKFQERFQFRIWNYIVQMYKTIRGLIWKTFKGMFDIIFYIHTKAACFILRSAFARMMLRLIIDKLGRFGIKFAWYDSSKVNNDLIKGYTKPLGGKGWEVTFLEYILALFTDSAAELAAPTAGRLDEIKCPVMIITGDTDRFVPLWNVRSLSKSIPTTNLEVIKKCGHLPHEESGDEFLAIVKRFLHQISQSSKANNIHNNNIYG